MEEGYRVPQTVVEAALLGVRFPAEVSVVRTLSYYSRGGDIWPYRDFESNKDKVA